jgi:hypothetical protein
MISCSYDQSTLLAQYQRGRGVTRRQRHGILIIRYFFAWSEVIESNEEGLVPKGGLY